MNKIRTIYIINAIAIVVLAGIVVFQFYASKDPENGEIYEGVAVDSSGRIYRSREGHQCV